MLYHLLKYMSWWTRFEVCYWLSVIFVRDNELCAFECVCFSWVECGMPCHVWWWEGARHGIVVGGFIRAELTSAQNWMNKMRYFPRMFQLGIFWRCPKCPLQRVSTRKISKIPIRLVRQYAESCDSTGGTDSAGAAQPIRNQQTNPHLHSNDSFCSSNIYSERDVDIVYCYYYKQPVSPTHFLLQQHAHPHTHARTIPSAQPLEQFDKTIMLHENIKTTTQWLSKVARLQSNHKAYKRHRLRGR